MPPVDPVLDDQETEEQRAEREAQEAAAKSRARGDHVEDPDAIDPDALAAVAGEGEDAEPKMVPYARFKEVNDGFTSEREARLRAEGEAAALRSQVAPPKPNGKDEPPAPVDIKALRRQANEALVEGDTERATELQAQADQAVIDQAAAASSQAQTAAIYAERVNDVAEAMAEKYPFLDSNGPEFDSKVAANVVKWRDFYTWQGVPPHKALQRAATEVGDAVVAEREKAAKPAGGKEGEVETPADTRQRQSIARAGEAALRQPPRPTGGKGDRTAQAADPDVAKMTDAEFQKLTPAEKARLRGDVV